MALPMLPTMSFIFSLSKADCSRERYRQKLGKRMHNRFYCKREVKKGRDNKIEMNSWFVGEL
jgi:hypothetical protein